MQQSQINTQTLSDIMDVQRSITRGKLDLDGAMRHIVESARKVANASGVAIALLKRDQLTYRAGSGTSAAVIGQCVTASLTVSVDGKNREILRVENAQTDTRIEADICRQFGASALLILPICHERGLAGVLDVRFNEAHTFLDREIRTYHLMAEQIEAAMLQAATLDQESKFSAAIPVSPDAFEPVPPPADDLVPTPEFFMLPENEHSLYARCGAVFAAITEMPAIKQSARLATKITQRARDFNWSQRWSRSSQAAARELSSVFRRQQLFAVTLVDRAQNLNWPNRGWTSAQAAARELSSVSKRATLFATQRAKSINWANRGRSLAVAAVAVLLVVAALIAYRGRGSAKSLESSTVPSSSANDRKEQLSTPLPSPDASPVQRSAALSNVARPANGTLRRVRVGPHEVDYIGEDVTVRIFSDRPTTKRTRIQASRVLHFGDDVTVRDFTPLPTAAKTATR